ncbi:MAG TPA: hypothetical protein VGJ39_01230 [Vicinamibacterales bacterium]|jgi:hypothetical protein
MRLLARLLVLLAVLALSIGPAFAAPLYSSVGARFSAERVGGPTTSTIPWTLVGLGLGALGITIRKDTASMAKKFVRNAGAAAGDYKDGVANAGGEWESRTKEAEGAYEQGVQEAIGSKRFGKGVSGSAGRYQDNAVKLGATRYPQGIQNAEAAWQTGVGPSLDALKGLSLPPRGPRRSPANMQRAEAVARTLGMVKTGR